MPPFFEANFWAGLVAWAALYVSDYYMTLTCARLYQNGVRDNFAFEGSYEITPQFQRDIDSLRRVSPRFFLALGLISAVLCLFWKVGRELMPGLYGFGLGMLISVQLAIHMRHLRNFHLFRAAARGEVRGRLEYPRQVMLRISSYEMLAFAAFFLVLFAFTTSWFVLGGVLGCLSVASKHWKLARAHASGMDAPAPESSARSTI